MNYTQAEKYCCDVLFPVIAERFKETFPYVFEPSAGTGEDEFLKVPYSWYMKVINSIDPYRIGVTLTTQKPLVEFDFIYDFTESIKNRDDWLILLATYVTLK